VTIVDMTLMLRPAASSATFQGVGDVQRQANADSSRLVPCNDIASDVTMGGLLDCDGTDAGARFGTSVVVVRSMDPVLGVPSSLLMEFILAVGSPGAADGIGAIVLATMLPIWSDAGQPLIRLLSASRINPMVSVYGGENLIPAWMIGSSPEQNRFVASDPWRGKPGFGSSLAALAVVDGVDAASSIRDPSQPTADDVLLPSGPSANSQSKSTV